MATLQQTWLDELRHRKANNLFRTRNKIDAVDKVTVKINGRRLLNFSSNNYLGLANHPNLRQAFIGGAETHGLGAGASQFISGYSRPLNKLEDEIAEFTGRERALLFSSGYLANLGAVCALLGRKDSVYLDRLCHASLIDAALLSKAAFRRYRHADAGELDQWLSKDRRTGKLVISDSIFSMDGDFAPLADLAKSCARHGALLFVDDAHGMGVMGANGAGSLQHLKLSQDDVPVLVGTFSKAFGLSGAFVAGSHELVEIIIQKGRSAIYSTALMPAIAAAASEALRLIKTESWRREKLFDLVQFFKKESINYDLNLLDSDTPIQPLIIGSSRKANQISAKLYEAGFYVPAVRPPTVPDGTARLRITITTDHTEEHVAALLKSIAH